MDIELDNKDFQNVWRLVTESSTSVFMTGRAGTGKSTFLRYIVQNIKKKTVVLAPTGIAAVNAGGVTLHSFFKIPLQPFALDDVNYSTAARVKEMQKYDSDKLRLLREVELIVIDEISMVRADVLDFVDRILCIYNPKKREPFGGKQLLVVGDAFQLEPVVTGQEWDILRRFYTTPYFFGAAVFNYVNLVQVELQKVYRQKEADFLSLLDRIRVGQAGQEDIDLINSRVDKAFNPDGDEIYMTLTSTRAATDDLNTRRLEELDSEPVVFEGKVVGDFPESSMPTNRSLTLKVGAQVVLVRNDNEGRWFNGTVGRIERFADDGVWVRVERDETKNPTPDDGEETPPDDLFFVEPVMWENVKYRYDEKKHKVVTELLGTFTQIPLKLAWAITIHKSQGLTFDRVIIDLGRGAFACGQLYVALSRCRTLAGIVLRSPVTQSDVKTSLSVRNFSYGANNEALINSQLESAKAGNLARQASDDFRNRRFRQAVDNAFEAFALSPDSLRNQALRRYVASRLAIVDRLNQQIEDLLAKQRQMKEKNFEFAYEYYLLAAECMHKYDDARAARANLNKAIALAPDYPEARLLRARIYYDSAAYDEALDDLNVALRPNALRKKNRLAEALLLRARVFSAKRLWEKAIADAMSALQLSKDRATLLFLADVHRRAGDNDKAERFSALADDLLNNDDDDDD